MPEQDTSPELLIMRVQWLFKKNAMLVYRIMLLFKWKCDVDAENNTLLRQNVMLKVTPLHRRECNVDVEGKNAIMVQEIMPLLRQDAILM
ncbi:hypothetical protein HAX54_013756, partial [Datura stramonium]|nr:hypothetical protein [Datura stramonium]